MLKSLFILLIFTLPAIALCQSVDTSYNNQLKVSVTRYLNYLNPAIEISYERLHGKRFSSQLSFGSPFKIFGKPYIDLKGYSVGVEEKYFLPSSLKSRKYVSVDFNYTSMNYKDVTSGIDTATNAHIIDTFTIRRKMQAVAIKYGAQFYRKRLVLDISIGAGLKYKNVKHYDRRFDYIGPREISDFYTAANVEKQGFAFILPLNLRLGYRF